MSLLVVILSLVACDPKAKDAPSGFASDPPTTAAAAAAPARSEAPDAGPPDAGPPPDMALAKPEPRAEPPDRDDVLLAFEEPPSDLKIRLDYARYAVDVDGEGKVEFRSPEAGIHTQNLPQITVLDFLHTFGKIGFLDITPAILDATCLHKVRDHGFSEIALTAGGRSNSVRYYRGCQGSFLHKRLERLEHDLGVAMVKPEWKELLPPPEMYP